MQDGRDFHILIDCGTLSSTDYLSTAIENLKPLLPLIEGKRRIDLLVVTHEHKDHMTGFGMKLWDGFSFGAIWMNAAMDPKHPEAEKAKKLHGFAADAMAQALRLNLALGPELMELANAMALNKDAMTTLRETLPKASKIKPTYVHADSSKADLALPLNGANISVLGPERDIDFYYLGDEGDPSLRRALGFIESGLPPVSAAVPEPAGGRDARRISIPPTSASCARACCRRRSPSPISTARSATTPASCCCIEWKGKRLLFVGDAEWDGGFKKGKGNCAWNVMWNLRKKQLNGPLAFLKIGHHGSVNATPVGTDVRGQQGRAAGHSRCDPSRSFESQGQGGRLDASGQLSNDPADRPSRRDRKAGIQHEELRRGVQEGRPKNVDRAEVRRVREASRSPSRSRFAPISSACSTPKGSLMWRSIREGRTPWCGYILLTTPQLPKIAPSLLVIAKSRCWKNVEMRWRR